MAHLTPELENCIENCDACRRACLTAMIHGLGAGGENATLELVRLLADCAEICQTSANFMTRGSDLHASTCDLCAEICDECAVRCTALDAPEMKECAAACRTCGTSCREMAGVAA